MTTCTICGNAHSDDCTPAALKARIAALSGHLDGIHAMLQSVPDATGPDPVSGVRRLVEHLREVERELDTLAAKIAALNESTALLYADREALWRVLRDACAVLRVTDDDEADWPKLTSAVTVLVQARDTLRAQLTASQSLAEDLRTRLIPALDVAGVDYDAPAGALAKAIGNREQAAEVLVGEVNRLRGQVADRQRLLDLVRHQRGPLHDAELISDEEYAALAGDHGAVARLEGYDEARAKLAEAKATIARLDRMAH